MSADDPKRTFSARTTSSTALHRWALNCPVGTENAAIARQGFKSLSTSFAVIKELAGVNRHVLRGLMSTLGAGDDGLLDHNRGSGSHDGFQNLHRIGRSVSLTFLKILNS